MYWFIYYLSFENFLHIFKEIRLYLPPIYTPPIPPNTFLSQLRILFSVHFNNLWSPISAQSWAWWMSWHMCCFSLYLIAFPLGSAAALLSQGAQSISTHFQPPAGDIVSSGEQAASSSPLPRGTQLHTGSLTQLHTKHKILERKAFPWGVLIKLIKCMSGT